MSFFACTLFAQSKEELQQKQRTLLREISNLNETLKEIRHNTKKSLANYNLVKRKISAREELIHSINKDMHILDNNIFLSQLEINRLKRELDTLRQEYARSLVFAYKNRSNYDYLNFIFSASTFNDAVKRITYLKSYRQYRENQVSNIEKTQQLINNKIASLNTSKTEKNLALKEEGKQLKVLEEDRKEQNEVVTKLKGQEKDLATQIKKREKERQQTQAALTAAIRRDQAEARKRAEAQRLADLEKKKKDAVSANPGVTTGNVATAPPKPRSTRVYSPLESTEESQALSINFEGSRGRLPWPVDAGNVTVPYGRYTIPGTKLVGQSDGITISVPVGASVKSIADGEVSSVLDLGGEQAVLIRHGKYYTTYSHLSSANVSRGQQVRAGTVLGRAAANDEGEGEVQFLVSSEKGAFLNPTGWLRGR